MDENLNKNIQNLESVVIFSKKELVLIFIFMILVGLISFAIGVKVGRNITYEKMGITKSDYQKVQLKSQKEEEVENVTSEMKERTESKESEMESDEAYKKLKDEFRKMNDDAQKPAANAPAQVPSSASPAKEMKKTQESLDVSKVEEKVKEKEDKVLKYTIQLGSYQYKDDAVRFADGFRIRGYNPIVREVPLANKGVWYRVALGTFETVEEAKKYIESEESLFAGQDYIITEF